MPVCRVKRRLREGKKVERRLRDGWERAKSRSGEDHGGAKER